MIVRAMVAESNLICVEPKLNPLLNIQSKINFAAFTPQQVNSILINEESKNCFKKIDTIIIGGGEISTTLEKKLIALNQNIFATYGMTETITHIAVRKIGEKIYKTFKGVNLGLDERNCLTIQVDYLGKNKIITNDIVEFEGPHEFIYKGRIDNVINSGGIKLHPEIIEHKIGDLINDSYFVHYKKDEELGQKLILVIERNETFDNTTLGLLQSSLKDILEKYEVPKEIVFLTRFKRTENGKVVRVINSQPSSNL